MSKEHYDSVSMVYIYITKPTTGLLSLGLLLISGLETESRGKRSSICELSGPKTLSTIHSPEDTTKSHFSFFFSGHTSPCSLSSSLLCVSNRLTFFFPLKFIKAHSLLKAFTHDALSGIFFLLATSSQLVHFYFTALNLVITFSWNPLMVF